MSKWVLIFWVFSADGDGYGGGEYYTDSLKRCEQAAQHIRFELRRSRRFRGNDAGFTWGCAQA